MNGTNRFTNVRFLVPELCSWSGMAIFVDACDMQLFGDIAELKALLNPRYAVQVVKHSYTPKSPRKYIGTELEADNLPYERKNWSSVILWNCGHIAHFHASDKIREAVEVGDGAYLHRFGWLKDSEIGELPIEWNHLVIDNEPAENVKLAHFSNGIPGFAAYANCEYAEAWKDGARRVLRGLQYPLHD